MKKLALLSFAALLFTSAIAGAKTVVVNEQHKVVIVDKTYGGHYGPGGQVIYLEAKTSKYYYIDAHGHHIYVTKTQMRTHR
jgi:hypothetical protein